MMMYSHCSEGKVTVEFIQPAYAKINNDEDLKRFMSFVERSCPIRDAPMQELFIKAKIIWVMSTGVFFAHISYEFKVDDKLFSWDTVPLDKLYCQLINIPYGENINQHCTPKQKELIS